MSGLIGGGGSSNAANDAAAMERIRQQNIRDGTARINSIFDGGAPGATSGFNDQFFDDRRQAYLDYATPQVDRQFGDAQKQLTFSLARGGLLDSSVRGDKVAGLQEAYDLNRQQVGDQALAFETDARNSVEGARSNLIAMLNATGDSQGAANSALAQAQALSQRPAFSPLTQLFTSAAEGFGAKNAADRADFFTRQAGLDGGGGGGVGLFARSPGSVRVGR